MPRPSRGKPKNCRMAGVAHGDSDSSIFEIFSFLGTLVLTIT
jgi:hypothetical protein